MSNARKEHDERNTREDRRSVPFNVDRPGAVHVESPWAIQSATAADVHHTAAQLAVERPTGEPVGRYPKSNRIP